MTDIAEPIPATTVAALPAPDIWAEAARRETGRDLARAAAIAALDPGLHERSPLETLYGVVARDPDQPAIVDAGRVISYRDFWNIVASFTAKLRAADAPAVRTVAWTLSARTPQALRDQAQDMMESVSRFKLANANTLFLAA